MSKTNVAGNLEAHPVPPETFKLNSFDEWSPLKEVIVGSGINYKIMQTDISFKLFHNDNIFASFSYPIYQGKQELSSLSSEKTENHKLKNQYLEELSEDIEGLVEALEKAHVRVHRPIPLQKSSQFETPYWAAHSVPALNVRDQAIIFGKELVETSPQIRARYFENDLLKPIFYHYFKLGARWSSMPRPIMTDQSFDLSYVQEVNRDMIATEAVYSQNISEFDVGHEILFDGAQCIRFGEDVLVNVSTRNHELGLEWLEKHFEGKFRFHRVYRLSDSHIDSIILPLRPGKLLLRDPKFLPLLPEFLQKWDIIYPPEPTTNNFPNYANSDLILTSKYIDLNVLSVNEDTVIVNSLSPDLIRTLEKNGFTVIPVQHRHRRIFGGGFHCFTLDTVREGKMENYFR
jgi:glycine amidinotransferase